jgi:hypothetical protein
MVFCRFVKTVEAVSRCGFNTQFQIINRATPRQQATESTSWRQAAVSIQGRSTFLTMLYLSVSFIRVPSRHSLPEFSS